MRVFTAMPTTCRVSSRRPRPELQAAGATAQRPAGLDAGRVHP